jgi:hypothetical protein
MGMLTAVLIPSVLHSPQRRLQLHQLLGRLAGRMGLRHSWLHMWLQGDSSKPVTIALG